MLDTAQRYPESSRSARFVSLIHPCGNINRPLPTCQGPLESGPPHQEKRHETCSEKADSALRQEYREQVSRVVLILRPLRLDSDAKSTNAQLLSGFYQPSTREFASPPIPETQRPSDWHSPCSTLPALQEPLPPVDRSFATVPRVLTTRQRCAMHVLRPVGIESSPADALRLLRHNRARFGARLWLVPGDRWVRENSGSDCELSAQAAKPPP